MSIKEELDTTDVAHGIKDIRVPTLVMWGDADVWIPFAQHFPQWQQALPHGEFIAYRGVGHVPMEEIPLQSLRDAQRFLSGVESAPMTSAAIL